MNFGSNARPMPQSPNSREPSYKEFRDLLARGGVHPNVRDILLKYANMGEPKLPDETPTSFENYLKDPSTAILNPKTKEIFLQYMSYMKEQKDSAEKPESGDAASTDKPSLQEIFTRSAGTVDQRTSYATRDLPFRDANMRRPQESNSTKNSIYQNVLLRYKNLPGLSTSKYNHEEVIRGIEAVSKTALAQINASVEAKEIRQEAETSGTNSFEGEQFGTNSPSEKEKERIQELPPYYGAFIHKIMQLEKYKYKNLLKVRRSLTDMDNLRLDVLERISTMLAERNRLEDEGPKSLQE